MLVVFNFLLPSEKEQKEGIVSFLEGININIYQKENYIGNAFHEIGHIFWRECLNYDEKKQFKRHADYLGPSAIYEYDWERTSEEEVFCTIYKWYLKSILLNKSFYNILEYEDPKGLKLIQDVMNRVAQDRIVNNVWDMKKAEIFEYT